MLNRESRTESGYLNDVPGWSHIMRNNLGYDARLSELTNIDKPACDLNNNYFDLDVTVSASDFMSVDMDLLTAPREADGSLPITDFLRLAPQSDLINKGVDIGFPFNGQAPDLGCYESDYATSTQNINTEKQNNFWVYPNPSSGSTQLCFKLVKESDVSFSVFTMNGSKVLGLQNKMYANGSHSVEFHQKSLNAGNYVIVAKLGDTIERQIITLLN